MILDLQQSAQLHHTEAETQTDRQISQITEGASVWQLWATKCWTTRQKVQWNRAENNVLTSGNCCLFMVSPDLKCCLKCSFFLLSLKTLPFYHSDSSAELIVFQIICPDVHSSSERYRNAQGEPFPRCLLSLVLFLLQETGPVSKSTLHGFWFGKK